MMKNKTVAVWLTLVLGPLGLHRPYLAQRFDGIAWLHLIPTLIGAYGVLRARSIGLDDHASWVLIPLVGFSVAAASLTAIVYGLMDAEKWNLRFNPKSPIDSASGSSNWLVIGGVVAALLLGATVLLSSIAFSFQRYFEYQAEQPPGIAQVRELNRVSG
jgi:hypothetical protein